MAIYIYDGSFDGLLCCIWECLHSSDDIELITDHPQEQASLFSDDIVVDYNRDNFQKCRKFMETKLPKIARRHIYYTFLSDAPHREMLIWKYMRYGMSVGRSLDQHITNDCVRQVHALSRKVGSEAHRMHGFVRFAKLSDGMYYARISPDHNILPIIGKHFAERLPDQRFMIHDVSRKMALMYDAQRWFVADIELHYDPQHADDEQYYQSLWKQYFQSIAIEARTNEKLQRQLVPLRYRKYLTEMQ